MDIKGCVTSKKRVTKKIMDIAYVVEMDLLNGRDLRVRVNPKTSSSAPSRQSVRVNCIHYTQESGIAPSYSQACHHLNYVMCGESIYTCTKPA